MRIQKIRFRNLNSLVGEWEIDLTHPAFVSDGIFAITGPTGAGKTTILDAVCLALYGRTPRLNKITKSSNEIMSRQTGECFAEVTIETRAGRYRCHWSQRRAHKRPNGELQNPRHEMVRADSGEVVESGIRGVADRIDTVTGMDFDRFTRSMLLAQGGFAAFLQAAPDERAPILEQITGTEIYSQISIRVHERHREEREKLSQLQAEIAGIGILPPEREEEMEKALESGQEEEKTLGDRITATEKAAAWIILINELKKEILSLTDEAATLQRDRDAFEPDQRKLDNALRAAHLDSAYATLLAIRKQQVEDQSALKTEEKNLLEHEAAAREQAEFLKSAELRTTRCKAEVMAAAVVWQQVRAIDQRLSHQQQGIVDSDAHYQQDVKKMAADQQEREKTQKKRAAVQSHLSRVDAYLSAHAPDEWLISGMTGIEEQLGSLSSLHTEKVQKEAEQQKSEISLAQTMARRVDCRKKCEARKQAVDRASQQLRQEKEALDQLLGDRLLREYRTEKETLLREMAFLTRIAELEDHRTQLEDGKPCPLCGATAHPFAEGNVPVPDDMEQKLDALTRLISLAENQEAAIQKCEKAEALAQKKWIEAEKQETAAAHDQNIAENVLADVKARLENCRADFTRRLQVVSEKLLPLGIARILDDDISTLLASLTSRRDAWQSQVRKKADLEKQMATIDSEMKRLEAVISTWSAALTEKNTHLEALRQELAAGQNQRKAIYGEKNPDVEERRLNQAVSDAEGAEKRARDRCVELRQLWSAANARAESLKNRIDQRVLTLEAAEAEFSAGLGSVGIRDENQFLEIRLSAAQREALAEKSKTLDLREADLAARKKDRETRLSTEMSKHLTDQSLAELEPRVRADQEALKTLRDTISGIRHTLRDNSAAKVRIAEKQATIAVMKNECRRWDLLHDLIGSADGKKYRNFAQGLTFEIMVGHANRKLRQMTDRYLLIRDHAQPLELNVIDSYQAGEIRSAKNLSGGESFIVSLALALGLSRMASRNVRVDSLFLDEGFGTLDEEALDTALETLAGLHQDGKLIGVISHVPALMERIGAMIRVIPEASGKSRISGPGCIRLNAGEPAVKNSP